MEDFGIGVEGDFLNRAGAYADRNPFHRSATSGTLRSVLNTWCEAQGYAWYWSFNKNAVVGVDLASATAMANFNKITSIIGTVQSQDSDGKRNDALIEQANVSATLKGTKKQYYITKAVKQAKADRGTNIDYYKPVNFTPIDINHLFAPEFRGGITGFVDRYRTDTHFRMSNALAKFNESSWEIFNAAIGCYEALGIQCLAKIADPTTGPANPAVALLQNALVNADLWAIMGVWQEFAQIKFHVYLVKYSEPLRKKWLDWEKSLADFHSKYYMNFDQLQKYGRCGSHGYGGVFRRSDATIPESEKLTRWGVLSGRRDLPFSNILLDPYGFRLSPNLFLFYNTFNVLDRKNISWDVSQADVDKVLMIEGEDVLLPWTPQIIPASGPLGVMLAGWFPFLNGGANPGGIVNWPAGMNNILINAQAVAALIGGGGIKPGSGVGEDLDIKYGILIHPDYQHANFPFKIGFPSYTAYFNTKEQDIINYSQYSSSRSYTDRCPLICDINVEQKICQDLHHLFLNRPFPHGLIPHNYGTMVAPMWRLPAFGFQIEFNQPPDPLAMVGPTSVWQKHSAKIIFPTWANYRANHKAHIERRTISRKVVEIYNDLENSVPGNVSSIDLVDTGDSAQNIMWPPTGGTGELNILLPNINTPLGAGHLAQRAGSPYYPLVGMTLAKYHADHASRMQFLQPNALMGLPRKEISCTLAGMEFGSLLPYMTPSSGLEIVSIRMTKDGVSTEVKFANRPPQSPNQEVMMHRLRDHARFIGRTDPIY
jgi:hypothetical protein